jgi:hypothetical protein
MKDLLVSMSGRREAIALIPKIAGLAVPKTILVKETLKVA